MIIMLEFLILLFLAGFFSCTETAITAITEAEYNKIKKGKGKKEKDLSVFVLKSPSTEALGVVGTFCCIDLVFNGCR